VLLIICSCGCRLVVELLIQNTQLRISSSKKQHCEIRNPYCHEDFAFMINSNTCFMCHQFPSSFALTQYGQYLRKQKDYEAHCHVRKIFTWYYYRSAILFNTTQVNGLNCHLVVLLGNQLAVQWLRDQWLSHDRNNMR